MQSNPRHLARDRRPTFGIPELYDGVNFVIVCMGVFGIGEILTNTERRDYKVFDVRLKCLVVRRNGVGTCFGAIMRGSGIGFILGLIPGGRPHRPNIPFYVAEKKLSAEPDTFGKGAIAGVAGPGTANNAGANASFIPLLTLGIPAQRLEEMPNSMWSPGSGMGRVIGADRDGDDPAWPRRRRQLGRRDAPAD